ncbi:MAG: family 16 glycosylhydrolase [Clostridia bacterium]|nr:family 16 glycosylhydrolase [Clostridia bacterium]
MFKRIFAVILTIAMLASLAACAGKAVPASVDAEGRFVYTIVRSGDKVIPAVEDAAKNLRSVMKENFECNVTITKDSSYEDFDGNYEVLVGDTNREESAKAKQLLLDNRDNYADDFIIAVIDDKICITAATDEMISIATSWFIENFCDDLEAWAKLKTGYTFIYAPERETVNNVVNGVNLGLYSVVLPRRTSLMVGMGADEFIDYYTDLGYSIKEYDDFLTSDEQEYEILFGDTVRDASKSVNVEGDNYVIKVVGKKLVVKGGTHLATWRAAQRLMEEIKENVSGEQGFNWPDGHTINGKYDATEEGTYTLNWYDEFEGSEIDFNKWGDYRSQASNTPTDSSLGGKLYKTNVYNECKYTGSDLKKLVYQADGCIVMGTQRVNEIDFVSSTISTYWTMTYKYGVMDIYGDLSEYPAYCSYWVNGASTTNPGTKFGDRFGYQSRACMTEVDILENFSKNNSYAANVHRWWTMVNADGASTGSAHNSMDGNALYSGNSLNNKSFKYDSEKYGDNMTDDFHMYSYYWDEESMKFAIDGKVFCDYKYTDNFSVSVHCLMNYLISSNGMGDPSYGATYNKSEDGDYYEHKIDYVRLYQTGAKNSQLITAWPQHIEKGESKIFYPENSIGARY